MIINKLRLTYLIIKKKMILIKTKAISYWMVLITNTTQKPHRIYIIRNSLNFSKIYFQCYQRLMSIIYNLIG